MEVACIRKWILSEMPILASRRRPGNPRNLSKASRRMLRSDDPAQTAGHASRGDYQNAMPSPVPTMPRETHLAAWCGGVIEAVWLAVAGTVPLIFSASGGPSAYQPYKFGTLRLLALVGLAAWLIEALERGSLPQRAGAGFRALLRMPLAIALAGFALVVAVSTAFSIDPAASLWGECETVQGAMTWAAELALIAMLATHLRRWEQVNRLVTVLLLTSLPVSLCALVQSFGWDPHIPGLDENRAFSTAGHPLFLGGYVVMLFPLAVWRLFCLHQHSESARGLKLLYWIILAGLLAAIGCTQSRGPVIAFVVGGFVLALLYAACRRSRAGLTVLALLAGLALVAGGLTGGSLQFLGKLPGFTRFSAVKSVTEGGEGFRAELWQRAPEVIFNATALPHPTGGADRWHGLRPWIGYGQETLEGVLPHYYTPVDSSNENRFHDLFWDFWYAFGGIGLLAFLAVFALALFYCLHRAGLVSTRLETGLYWGLISGGALLVAGLLAWKAGAGMVGMGFLVGGILGLVGYAFWRGWRGLAGAVEKVPPAQFLLLALAAALAGHLVDLAFVFRTAITAMLFIMETGLLLALLRGVNDETEAPENTALPANASAVFGESFPVAAAATVLAILLCAAIYGFVHEYLFQPLSVLGLLSQSLLHLPGANDRASLKIVPLLALWLGGSYALASRSGRITGDRFLKIWLGSGVIALAYLLFKTMELEGIGLMPGPATTSAEVMAQAVGYGRLFVLFALGLGLLTLVSGWLLVDARREWPMGSQLGIVGVLVALVAVPAAAWQVSLRPLQASCGVEWATYLQANQQLPLALEVFQRSVDFNPRTFVYRDMLAEVLSELSQASSSPQDAAAWRTRAEATLLDIRGRSDLNRSSYFLGRLYLLEALSEAEPARSETARKAMQALRQAAIFETDAEQVYTLTAIVDTLLLQNSLEATQWKERARAIAARDFNYWANLYSNLSVYTRDPGLRNQYSQVACDYLDGIIHDPKSDPKAAAHAGMQEGRLLIVLKRLDEAEPRLQAAAQAASPEDGWQIQTLLAQIYVERGALPMARQFLARAYDLAPAEKKATIRQYQAQLGE